MTRMAKETEANFKMQKDLGIASALGGFAQRFDEDRVCLSQKDRKNNNSDSLHFCLKTAFLHFFKIRLNFWFWRTKETFALFA